MKIICEVPLPPTVSRPRAEELRDAVHMAVRTANQIMFGGLSTVVEDDRLPEKPVEEPMNVRTMETPNRILIEVPLGKDLTMDEIDALAKEMTSVMRGRFGFQGAWYQFSHRVEAPEGTKIVPALAPPPPSRPDEEPQYDEMRNGAGDVLARIRRPRPRSPW